MATRRFCDRCDLLLEPEDDQPFVRELRYGENSSLKAIAYVAITNEQKHPLTDLCNGCKLEIVTDGTTPDTTPRPKIATLQPQVPADSQVRTPFFALPKEPPKVAPRTPEQQPNPPMEYEPSFQVHQDQ
jgi:hypothetical protein